MGSRGGVKRLGGKFELSTTSNGCTHSSPLCIKRLYSIEQEEDAPRREAGGT